VEGIILLNLLTRLGSLEKIKLYQAKLYFLVLAGLGVPSPNTLPSSLLISDSRTLSVHYQ